MSKQSEYAIIADRLMRGEHVSIDLTNESLVMLLDAYENHPEHSGDGLFAALSTLTEDLGLEPESIVKLLDRSTRDRLECDLAERNLLKFKPKTASVTGRFGAKT